MASAISSRRRLLDPGTRERVLTAKRVVVFGCAAAFGVAFGLTKASHPSHPKHPLRQLDAPAAFVRQLQNDQQLRGGVIAAPQAPPEAQTAAS